MKTLRTVILFTLALFVGTYLAIWGCLEYAEYRMDNPQRIERN